MPRRHVPGILLSILGLFFYPGWILGWELKTYDFRMRCVAGHPGPEIVIVTVDSDTVKEFGGYPLDRNLYTQMTEQLSAAGAKVIGFDINFVKADPVDDAFAAAIQSAGNVVLADLFMDYPRSEFPDEPVRMMEVFRTELGRVPAGIRSFSSIQTNAARINSTAGKDSAFVNANLDFDIVMRGAPMVAKYRGRYYPSFAVAVLRRYLGVERGKLSLGGFPAEHIEIGTLSVPTGQDGMLNINFRGGPRAFTTYSFLNVIHGRVPAALFKEKIVLIGASTALARDIWNTPVGFIPGTEIVAHEIDTIRSNAGISDFRERWPSFLLIPMMGWGGCWWLDHVRPRMILPWTVAILVVFVTVETLLFTRWGIWLAMVYPALVLVAGSLWTIQRRLKTPRTIR